MTNTSQCPSVHPAGRIRVLGLAAAFACAALAGSPASGQATQPGAAPPAAPALPEGTLTAAQIQQTLDKPVEPMAVNETPLIELLKQLEGKRARWLDIPGSTLSFLPYGEETAVSLRIAPGQADKATLRVVLDSLLDPLSLTYRIIEDSRGRGVLRLVPRPELFRVGRRASIDELALIHALRHLKVEPARASLSEQASKAAGRPIEIQFQLSGLDSSAAAKRFNESLAGMQPNTAAGLLDQFVSQGAWTWRVEENVIKVVDKTKQVLHQLQRHVSVKWNGLPLEDALVQLGNAGGVLAQFQPGLMEGIEYGSRTISWQTPDEAVLQIIETLSARTGLSYEVREESIYFFGPRGSRFSSDPVIGMVTIPTRTGQFSVQLMLRKSMLSKEAQDALDARLREAADAMTKELTDPKLMRP